MLSQEAKEILRKSKSGKVDGNEVDAVIVEIDAKMAELTPANGDYFTLAFVKNGLLIRKNGVKRKRWFK